MDNSSNTKGDNPMVELTKEMCEQLLFSKLNMILKGRNGFYMDSTMKTLREELESLCKIYPSCK